MSAYAASACSIGERLRPSANDHRLNEPEENGRRYAFGFSSDGAAFIVASSPSVVIFLRDTAGPRLRRRPAHTRYAAEEAVLSQQDESANAWHGWLTDRNVGAHTYGADMTTRWSGDAGRYQAKCGQGHCALTGDQATSKIQGEIFTLLDYVIGPGHRDQCAFAFRSVRLDMVFTIPSGRALVVEYDGAYWHRNQEERDFRKARAVEEAWRHRGCVVVRIRENPLTPLYPLDVQVPARSDALTCARLVLLHLLHEMPDEMEQCYGEGEVGSFLRSSRRPLPREDVRCEICKYVASERLSAEVFSRTALPRKRKSAAVLPIDQLRESMQARSLVHSD